MAREGFRAGAENPGSKLLSSKASLEINRCDTQIKLGTNQVINTDLFESISNTS